MKTTSTVNSKTNGTLKMKKDNINFRNLLAALFLGSIAMFGMSFTTEDTTKTADADAKTKVELKDSCCVTSIGGNKLATEVKFSVTTTLQEAMRVKNFTKLNLLEIGLGDKRMDINFRLQERKNTEMAVAFKNTLANQASEADSQLSENLLVSTVAPAFGKKLFLEMQVADGTIDELVNEEADFITKTIAYKTVLSSQILLADENIDQMLNISTLKTIEQSSIESADKLMDTHIQKSILKNINKSIAVEADVNMDELINKN